jgi:hypothetical protein
LEAVVPEPGSEAFAVEMSGELTIRTAADMHARLAEAFLAHDDVVASVDETADMDLTFIQLIESARRSAREAGGSFALAAPAEGGLLAILRRGGFLETPAQREFWLQDPRKQ